MSCGCKKQKTCGCSDCTACTQICTALPAQNSWNVPGCGVSAVLSFPGLTTTLIGAYLYNPTYGAFRITAIDSVNGQITVVNECLAINAVPGTTVPALTEFMFSIPPQTTNITYAAYATGTPYSLTNASAPVVFGTVSPVITLTIPGTYIIFANVSFGSGLTVTTPGVNAFVAGVKRENNTPGFVIPSTDIFHDAGALVTYTGILASIALQPTFYTTLNSTDSLSIEANYTGGAPSLGALQVMIASIQAIKLS